MSGGGVIEISGERIDVPGSGTQEGIHRFQCHERARRRRAMWMIFVGFVIVIVAGLFVGSELVARLGILLAPLWAVLCAVAMLISAQAVTVEWLLLMAGYAIGGALAIVGFGIALAWLFDDLPHRTPRHLG
jgi:drug/metabolite transporter (DMT)-like permease